MTSGSFHAVNVDAILVHRDERQRKKLTKIEELAESIHRLGLIHPIVVTRDNVLVAGERRLAACKSLGHEKINCQYADELDEFTLKAIELEENIKRSDIEWQDECMAVTAYHELRCAHDSTWNQAKTAEAIGLTQPYVSNHLRVAEEIKKGNAAVTSSPRFSTAIGIAQRNESRRDEKALQELRKDANVQVDTFKRPPSIINADFLQWAQTYDGPKFNFIHCDFPYGINVQVMQQGGSVATHGAYEDSEDNYWRLLDCLFDNLDRLASESCHIMFWFSMHHYTDTLARFERDSDFVMDPFPLVWLKSDNIGLLPDPQRGPRRIYETALFGARGDRKIVGAVSNAYAAPTDRTQHMSTKPEPVLRHYFRMFVDENSLVLDPTCGSGSALRAAESLGAAHILGVEINRDFTERANLTIEAARRMRG